MALDLDTIRNQAQRVAASHGLDVVDLEMAGGGKHRFLRIFIEKNAEQRARLAGEQQAAESEQPGNPATPGVPNMEALSGVTHEDCEVFSRDFGTLLDIEDLVPGSAEYTLEVSSPGLDRKLYTPADYHRFTGSVAKIQTRQPVNGNRHYTGRLQDVTETDFALELEPAGAKGKKKTAKATEQTLRFPYANIEKANLVPEI